MWIWDLEEGFVRVKNLEGIGVFVIRIIGSL